MGVVEYKDYSAFTLCIYVVVWCLCLVVMWMPKLRLFVRSRKQGSRIESVPVKRLVELASYRKTRWSFVDGWLILEAF